MTPSEQEDLTIARIEAGAVNQNAVICKCGRIIHYPNNAIFRDCLFHVKSCDWCESREEGQANG